MKLFCNEVLGGQLDIDRWRIDFFLDFLLIGISSWKDLKSIH